MKLTMQGKKKEGKEEEVAVGGLVVMWIDGGGRSW